VTVDDERLMELMRQLDPAQTSEGPLPPAAHRALLRRITTTPLRRPPARGARRLRASGWWPEAAFGVAVRVVIAVIVLAVVIVSASSDTGAAIANTPASLRFTPAGLSLQRVHQMLEDRLDGATGAPEAERRASYAGWYLQHEDDETSTSTTISPQVSTLQWDEDRSGRFLVVSGDPYPSADADERDDAGGPAAGTVLIDTTFGPGEYDVPPTTAEPGSTPPAMQETLAAYGAPPEESGFSVIEAIASVLSVWTLTDRQQVALLTNLFEHSDVSVHGATTDRVGRQVIGITADSTSGNRDVLLMSTETGRIVGLETTRTTAWEDVPAGATTAYTIWEITP
jgi:hypothetical protein